MFRVLALLLLVGILAPTSGCSKEAPKQQVDPNAVNINMPGMNIKVGPDGAQIQGPGVNVNANNKGGANVNVPGVNVNVPGVDINVPGVNINVPK